MKVLSVAPLASGIPYEELTYFSKDDVFPGDLVEIPIKKRLIRALVLTAVPAEEERQSLRNASFGVRKVERVITKEFLHPKLWASLAYVSSYLLIPLGTLLYDLLSERSFDQLEQITPSALGKLFDLSLLEQNTEGRMTRYKTAIRESFSKKQSIVIYFPTINDLDIAYQDLSRGIDEYAVMLHGGLTEKQYKESLEKIAKEEHALLILSTPSLLPWMRSDIGSLIIEREHSHYYYTHGEYGYDMRIALEHIGRGSSVPTQFGSHMLSLRAHKMYKELDAHESIPLQYRNDAGIMVVQMTEDNRSSSPYLSRQALHMLHEAKKSGHGHYFLYAHRKGMYPSTVCSDCGELFTCDTCNRPYVLHRIAGYRTYVCHGCENIVRLDEDQTLSCKHCGGWRMTTLGIATGGVEEELMKLGIPVFVIDGERTPSKAKVKKVMKEWRDAPFGLLIGTEMAHNALAKTDGVIILSLDSLFSLPEYRNDEKVLTLVTEMAEKVKDRSHGDHEFPKILLQTRLHKLPVIKQLTTPSFREVFQTLLRERERFLLPPYYTVIKSSFENVSEELKERIEKELRPHPIEWYEQGRGVSLLFIHVHDEIWKDDEALRARVKLILSGCRPLVNPLHFFIQ